ncbi:hypothetical protein [Emticicia agri]|uniref:Bulb-type lectin domain-containing protein n=1 Tax=Emticicia agri TaxID=2492393 RepID=A0A4Q5M121_9BACT|nr:hypothetical protein [Emticicia agri]RYU95537.1 hypothetical protein EWM59_11625 [Emticicia agri]
MRKILFFTLITFTTLAQFNSINPIVVATGGYAQLGQTIADDKNSIVVYSNSGNIFIQKIDSAGNKLWGSNGIRVSNREVPEGTARVALCKTSTGNKRYVVVWRTNSTSPAKCYAQSYD